MQDQVVLLHGIFRTALSFSAMEKFLRGEGVSVLNVGYPSTRHGLEQLVEEIHPAIAAFNRPPARLHFVGYSMGALVARAYIHRHRPANLGRVVMLAPPNQGSPVADVLKPFPLFRFLYGPAGQQLGCDQSINSALFGPVDYELGILAGNRVCDPISSLLIGEPNDGKVAVAATRLEGMKEHLVVPATHTFIQQNRKVWRYTANFLKNGSFGAVP